MKLLVLWQQATGYLAAGLQRARLEGWEVELVSFPPSAAYPFSFDELFRGIRCHNHPNFPDRGRIQKWDAVLISGWRVGDYRAFARQRPDLARIVCFDMQFRSTPKQILASSLGRFVLPRYFDAAFVPGPRQAAYAGKLGFKPSLIEKGCLTFDSESFYPRDLPREDYFLYAGRFSREKGVGLLIESWIRYRENGGTKSLKLIGSPGNFEIPSIPDLEVSPFISPKELAMQMSKSAGFILASTFEPWGNVLVEAAATATPIATSNVAGAVDEVWRGIDVSRWSFDPLDSHSIELVMHNLDDATNETLKTYGQQLHHNATQLAPTHWLKGLTSLMERVNES